MKKIFTTLFVLLSLSMSLVGCKKPPLEEIASAEAAIQAARDAEAPKYAADTFAAAESKLKTAYGEVETEKYDLARSNAISARELAEAAAREARKRKAEDELAAKKEKELRAEKGEFDPEVQATVDKESLTGAGITSRDLPPIYFDFDAYALRADQREALNKAVTWLLDHEDIRLRLEGHTDERGEAEYNLALGRRRALAVKDDLVAAGIASTRIDTVSLGEEDPAQMESNESAWAANRRVEFLLLRPNENIGTN